MEEVSFLEGKIENYIAYLEEVKSLTPQKIIIDSNSFLNEIDN